MIPFYIYTGIFAYLHNWIIAYLNSWIYSLHKCTKYSINILKMLYTISNQINKVFKHKSLISKKWFHCEVANQMRIFSGETNCWGLLAVFRQDMPTYIFIQSWHLSIIESKSDQFSSSKNILLKNWFQTTLELIRSIFINIYSYFCI